MNAALPKRRIVGWGIEFRPTARSLQDLLAYVLIPLLVGYCVISRAFQGDGFLPIDTGDEPAETFVQLPLAQAQLAAGDLPKMNLFNNFGTPILGEPVVYPFALHAWSYALFRPVVAMLVNKFVLAALSMAVLTVFFSRYFPPLIGSFCAFLTFSSPAFFYFFQNHPHQGTLFYYGLILVALRWFLDGPTAPRGFWLYAVFLFFLLSVGINGALLGTIFLLAYAVLVADQRWKALGWALALWAAAGVAVYPHFLEFFRLAAASARKDLDYQTLTSVPHFSFIKTLFSRENEVLQADIFYSTPVIVLIAGGLGWAIVKAGRASVPASPDFRSLPEKFGLAGTLALPERAVPRQSSADRRFRELCRLLFILGLAPGLAVIVCRLFPAVPAAVPLLKAMNVSRILWFSDVFLLLAAGLAANAVYQAARPYHVAWRLVWVALLLVSLGARISAFRAQAGFFCITESYTLFQPAEFLSDMKPYTRLATLADPFPISQDTKAARNGILGSAGRSIILDKALRDYLLQRKLIELGCQGMTYFFRPAPPDVLARFGIRYCLTSGRDDQLAEWGWRPLVIAQDAGRPVFALYGNPSEVTPLYIAGPQPEFLQRYRLAGNEIEAELPPKSSAYEVVATFLARRGWKAYIDHQPAPLRPSEEHFMRVRVDPSQSWRKLLLKYEPYSNAWLLGCVLFSLAGAGLLCRFLSRAARQDRCE